jgi:flagellar biosynthetic protein FliR
VGHDAVAVDPDDGLTVELDLALDAHWATGYLLAMTRVAAFVVASPLLPRSIPVVGRAGFTMVVGLALTTTVPDVGFGALLASMAVNVMVGLVLGYLTGIVLHVFTVAGDLLDVSSGLSVAAVFDPLTGDRGAVLGRMFPMAGLALFMAVGGLAVVARGLGVSVAAVPLDGSVRVHEDMIPFAIDVTARLLVAGIELALPAVAALFLTEVVLGLAARFAPQANVLMLGLPLKVLVLLVTAGMVVLLFPEAMAGVMETIERTTVDVMRGLTPG